MEATRMNAESEQPREKEAAGTAAIDEARKAAEARLWLML
jgi:hypothetical protein